MSAEKSKVASISLIAAVVLVSMKLLVGVATGSLGILSEALHSALDFLAALITWVSVKLSDKPADSDHNFGHGKIENFSALLEALLLLATCAWIVYEALSRLFSGNTHIDVGVWSYVVVIASIAIDSWRSRELMRAAKKYKSQALEADALHFSTDILSSFVVLLGLVCANFGYFFADSVAALGVALIVIWVSLRLSMRAVNSLLDKAPEGLHESVEKIISGVDGVVCLHDLRVRSVGPEYEIDVNVHVDPKLSLVDAHDISERVERAVSQKLGNIIINVHIEPDS
ncbi:cation diffusion facilitator family transporter [Coraliomargarita sp. CAG:312]|nr:cation diffusion facilitator family transporter [Coraliomargarita sp. CAG:312]